MYFFVNFTDEIRVGSTYHATKLLINEDLPKFADFNLKLVFLVKIIDFCPIILSDSFICMQHISGKKWLVIHLLGGP